MTGFTTRVELHAAKAEDYDRLHEAMEAQGFKRSITSDDGVAYDLPTAEYYYEGNVTRNNVLEKTKVAAGKTGKKYGILVTEGNGWAWTGLPKSK
ncbi:hypothetical protein [Ralstonia pseudosolanacearum]|uniref:hypothetical protein n=1 Tax=Ralstonia pseudosolanacearum TaxID=1310165 RepID=UPI0005C3D7BD|nr:hypothetical protein [Ralstonia pseudosolanacearum]AST27083.1 hypothetical protein CDC45_07675 [Ralstonia pseudosolanacearum]MCQ4680792.1 hypothetical protein [Ralstonia pseudosolanacearum]MDC6286766.1 hypothetical protein [Ralstonia pseudosolanacearum]